jgi:hypothetical protein
MQASHDPYGNNSYNTPSSGLIGGGGGGGGPFEPVVNVRGRIGAESSDPSEAARKKRQQAEHQVCSPKYE